jgi:hypothetical protein
MALPNDHSVARTENQSLSRFVDNLTLEDQRTLSRLLNSWEKKDQRQHARERCSIITDYIVDNHNYKGIMLNIAPSGAYIASRHLFPVNQVIFQSFFFPNFEIPIRSHSKIVWVGSDGFGVQFDSLQSDE